jgi:hypothetical protein
MTRRHPLLPAVLFGAAISPLTATLAVAQEPVAAGAGARGARFAVEPCAATVVRHETLRDSAGNLLYIAPDAVVAHEGELLLAGHASILFTKGPDGAFSEPVPSAFSVIVRDRQGRVRTYPAPPPMDPTTLRDLRATRLPGGRWGVLFFEEREPARMRSVRNRVFLAELGPSGWERVDELPAPPEAQFIMPVPRSIAVRGDRVQVAMSVQGDHDTGGVMLYRRDRGRWTSHLQHEPFVTAADIAFAPRDGSVGVLSVRSDLEPRTANRHEVFLRVLPEAPSRRGLIRATPVAPAYDPLLHHTGSAWSASWIALEQRANGIVHTANHAFVTRDRTPASLVIADDIAWFVTVPMGDGAVLAVTSAQGTADTTIVDLQLLPESPRGVRLRHPSPYARLMAASRWSASEIVVALVRATTTGTFSVNTELLWLEAQCSTDSAEGRRVP